MKSLTQSAAMLSAMSASIHFAGMSSKGDDLPSLCNNLHNDTVNTISNWPGITIRHCEEAVGVIQMWQVKISDSTNYPVATLLYMASRILDDLEFKLNNRPKKFMLSVLRKSLDVILDVSDPDRDKFDEYELGDELLDELYSIIKWEM